MRNINSLAFEIISCGVFDTANIVNPYLVHRSPDLITDKYVLELPFETGGKHYINGKFYDITPDCIFFVRPNSTRYTVYPNKCLCLHFSINDDRFEHLLDDIPVCLKLKNRDKIYKSFLETISLFTDRPKNHEISILANFFNIINLILKDASANPSEFTLTLPRNAIIKTRNYINDNYQSKITLEQLSGMVNLSPIYFQRIFTVATGKSPHKYLLDRRLEVAKELLLVSNHSLNEIAHMCGFSSQSRFNIVFKQNEGLTPTEYKTKNRIDTF